MRRQSALIFALLAPMVSAQYFPGIIADNSGGTAGASTTTTTLNNGIHGQTGWNFGTGFGGNTQTGFTYQTSSITTGTSWKRIFGPTASTYTQLASPLALDLNVADSNFVPGNNCAGPGVACTEYYQICFPGAGPGSCTNSNTIKTAWVSAWFSSSIPANYAGGLNMDSGPTIQSSPRFNNTILRIAGGGLQLSCETGLSGDCNGVDVNGVVNGTSGDVQILQSNFASASTTHRVLIVASVGENFFDANQGTCGASGCSCRKLVFQENAIHPGTVNPATDYLGGIAGCAGIGPSGFTVPYLYVGDVISLCPGNNCTGPQPTGHNRFESITACGTTVAGGDAFCNQKAVIPTGPYPWSDIIDPTRATDWSVAGIQGGIPVWPQCTAMQAGVAAIPLPAGTTGAQVAAALANCSAAVPAGSHLDLAAGAFTWIDNAVKFPNSGHVSLRGQGPTTQITVIGGGGPCKLFASAICIVSPDTSGAVTNPNPATVHNWNANFAQGTSTITLDSAASITAGMVIGLDQCDTATTLVVGCTGTQVDNSALFIAEDKYIGASGATVNGNGGSEGNRPGRVQFEIHTVTNISGNNVTISPPVIGANFVSTQFPQVWAYTTINQVGIENMAIDAGSTLQCIELYNIDGWWISGVTCKNFSTPGFSIIESLRGTAQSNYFYNGIVHGTFTYGMRIAGTSSDIFQNNIFQQVEQPLFIDGSDTGSVFGYNFSPDDPRLANSEIQPLFNAHSGDYYELVEGNILPVAEYDVYHGTEDVNTYNRNFFPGWGSNISFPRTGRTNGIEVDPKNRYHNIIANVAGTPGYHTAYKTSTGNNLAVFSLGSSLTTGSTIPNDPLSSTTALPWGNYDTFTGTSRFCGASVDTGWIAVCGSTSETPLSAVTYPNFVPYLGDTAYGQKPFPASFYLGTSRPSWWPQSIPFPAIGPDVTASAPTNVGQCTPFSTSVARAGLPATSVSQCPSAFTASAWALHVNANPAMMCAVNIMGMPLDGSGPALTFDPTACYAPSPSVSPTSLGPYTQGQSVSVTVTGFNFGTITWSLLSGSPPTGMGGTCITGTTGPTCTLTTSPGTLTAAGTFPFTIRATDGTNTVNTPYTVIVNPAPQVTTACPLPSGTVAVSYNSTGSGILTNTGGTTPFTWDLSAGSLPSGLCIGSGVTCTSSSVSIIGTPVAVGASIFTLRVTDFNGIVGTEACSLTINGTGTPPAAGPDSGLVFSGILH